MAVEQRAGRGTRHTPESSLGRWAVVMGALTLTSVVLMLLSLATGLVDLPGNFDDNPAFGAWGVSVWVTGAAAVMTGVVAITRRHDRSSMVLVATALGCLPVVLLLSEAALGKV